MTGALFAELALTAGFAVGWWATSSNPDENWQLMLLGTNAIALGLQSSAVQRFGVSGLSTTYLTGTLTYTVIRLPSRQPIREVGTARHCSSH